MRTDSPSRWSLVEGVTDVLIMTVDEALYRAHRRFQPCMLDCGTFIYVCEALSLATSSSRNPSACRRSFGVRRPRGEADSRPGRRNDRRYLGNRPTIRIRPAPSRAVRRAPVLNLRFFGLPMTPGRVISPRCILWYMVSTSCAGLPCPDQRLELVKAHLCFDEMGLSLAVTVLASSGVTPCQSAAHSSSFERPVLTVPARLRRTDCSPASRVDKVS